MGSGQCAKDQGGEREHGPVKPLSYKDRIKIAAEEMARPDYRKCLVHEQFWNVVEIYPMGRGKVCQSFKLGSEMPGNTLGDSLRGGWGMVGGDRAQMPAAL